MPERFVQDNLPWLYALILSFWGCAVQYATRLKKGETASLGVVLSGLGDLLIRRGDLILCLSGDGLERVAHGHRCQPVSPRGHTGHWPSH